MSTLIADESLLKNTSQYDVIFVVDGKEIPAHRAIISQVCPHFEKLLYGHFKESKSKHVEIKETSIKAFKQLIRFIYKGLLEVSDWKIKDLLALLSLAHKYEFQSLFDNVVKVLEIKPLHLDCWTFVNSAATIFDVDTLRQKCRAFAEAKVDPFLRLEDLNVLTSELICAMFDTPKIFTCDQEILLRALMEWKKYHSAAEVMSVFPKICWENVSPKISAAILREVLGKLANPDELNFWNGVPPLIEEQSKCIIRLDNVSLVKNIGVELLLPKYQCSISCWYHGKSFSLCFLKNNSRIEIPVKSIELEFLNHCAIEKILGSPLEGRTLEMVVCEPMENNCFKYSATFAVATPITFIGITSQHFKETTEIRLKTFIIY